MGLPFLLFCWLESNHRKKTPVWGTYQKKKKKNSMPSSKSLLNLHASKDEALKMLTIYIICESKYGFNSPINEHLQLDNWCDQNDYTLLYIYMHLCFSPSLGLNRHSERCRLLPMNQSMMMCRLFRSGRFLEAVWGFFEGRFQRERELDLVRPAF